MEITDSSRTYLTNYYVLEQTRTETHRFLEEIAIRSLELVYDHIKPYNDQEIKFRKFIQKDGGYAEIKFERQEHLQFLEDIGSWKYTIAYRDAMRTEDLASPTHCRIYCYSPKSHSKQISELKRMAVKLKLPDPYGSKEIDLLNASVDEVVVQVANTFIDYYDNFMKIVEALIDEYSSAE